MPDVQTERLTLTIGAAMRLIRKAAGHTQSAAGELIGVSGPAISQIELGLHRPTDRTLAAFTTAYGHDPRLLVAISHVRSLETEDGSDELRRAYDLLGLYQVGADDPFADEEG